MHFSAIMLYHNSTCGELGFRYKYILDKNKVYKSDEKVPVHHIISVENFLTRNISPYIVTKRQEQVWGKKTSLYERFPCFRNTLKLVWNSKKSLQTNLSLCPKRRILSPIPLLFFWKKVVKAKLAGKETGGGLWKPANFEDRRCCQNFGKTFSN